MSLPLLEQDMWQEHCMCSYLWLQICFEGRVSQPQHDDMLGQMIFSFVLRSCHLHCRMLNSIPGLYPLEASSSVPQIVTTENVFRHCQTPTAGSRVKLLPFEKHCSVAMKEMFSSLKLNRSHGWILWLAQQLKGWTLIESSALYSGPRVKPQEFCTLFLVVARLSDSSCHNR